MKTRNRQTAFREAFEHQMFLFRQKHGSSDGRCKNFAWQGNLTRKEMRDSARIIARRAVANR